MTIKRPGRKHTYPFFGDDLDSESEPPDYDEPESVGPLDDGPWSSRGEADEVQELRPERDFAPAAPEPDRDYTEEWDTISYRARDQAGWECSGCGKSFQTNQSQLQVHHRDHNTSNNAPVNLQVLCRACHELAHGRRFS